METPEVGDRVRIVNVRCYEQGLSHGMHKFIEGLEGTILPCPNPAPYHNHPWRVGIEGRIPEYFAASELELVPAKSSTDKLGSP